MSAAPVDATCPSCGAPLKFSVGQSRAAVCSYCHALVARKGQDFTAVGKVADLIPTGTRLQLGLEGKLGENALRLVGRIQYEWAQGAWDEWYVSVGDSRWGWLAEAQGRYYLTFPEALPDDLPSFDVLRPGSSFTHQEHGRFVLTDRKRARIASVDGELPQPVRPGSETRTADFQGPRSTFGTIDYSDETPRFFLGREVLLEQLHLTPIPETPATRARAGAELKCPNCHAPIQLRVPDQSVRAICESCGAILDTSKDALQVLTVLSKLRSVPPIPIGTKGTLRGRTLQVVGWMRRGCEVDGEHYDWQELLLYEPKTTGFAWLVLSDGHWQLAEPISAADVVDHTTAARYDGRSYRFFSRVEGEVEEVLGEFYWAVGLRDRAELSDYTGVPNGLSREATEDEVNWSFLTHLERKEIADAFGRPGLRAEPQSGVGMIQPYPYSRGASAVYGWCGLGALAVLALALVFAAQGKTLVYQHDFSSGELMTAPPQPVATPPAPTDPSQPLRQYVPPPGAHSHAFLSDAFTLPAHRAVEVQLETGLDNHWAYADGALVPAQGGPSEVFGLEAAYYHGYDSDGSWAEGDRSPSASLTAPAPGSYVVRADVQWDPQLPFPPPMVLRVYSGGNSGWQLIFAWLALLGPIVIMASHRAMFEQARWQSSTVKGANG